MLVFICAIYYEPALYISVSGLVLARKMSTFNLQTSSCFQYFALKITVIKMILFMHYEFILGCVSYV